MKVKMTKWIGPALFILDGALVGFAYYYFVGCTTVSGIFLILIGVLMATGTLGRLLGMLS